MATPGEVPSIKTTAAIDNSRDGRSGWPEAQFAVVVRVGEVFPNCPRYIHHYQLVQRSKFVPKKTVSPPVPDWKRSDWACDVLADNDPAREPAPAE